MDVLCFGMLKELLGSGHEVVDLGERACVGDVLAWMRGRVGAESETAGAAWKSIAVAVNQEYAGLATVLKDGDEVALLPPVSGGCDAG